jgi:hypothetical protein
VLSNAFGCFLPVSHLGDLSKQLFFSIDLLNGNHYNLYLHE